MKAEVGAAGVGLEAGTTGIKTRIKCILFLERGVGHVNQKGVGDSVVRGHAEMALLEPPEVPGGRVGGNRRGFGGGQSETTCLALAKGPRGEQADRGGEKSLQHHGAGDAL